MPLSHCPICNQELKLQAEIEVHEIVNCPGCGNRLMVVERGERDIILEEAPKVEEDWGE